MATTGMWYKIKYENRFKHMMLNVLMACVLLSSS